MDMDMVTMVWPDGSMADVPEDVAQWYIDHEGATIATPDEAHTYADWLTNQG